MKRISKQVAYDIVKSIATANHKMLIKKLKKIGGFGDVTSAYKKHRNKDRFFLCFGMKWTLDELWPDMNHRTKLAGSVLDFIWEQHNVSKILISLYSSANKDAPF